MGKVFTNTSNFSISALSSCVWEVFECKGYTEFVQSLTDTLDGFPIWMSFVSVLHQYALFPMFHWFASMRAFNLVFTAYFIKDFFYDIDMALTAHHVVALAFIYKFSINKDVTRAFTVAEFGSGGFNVYILAKHYDVSWVSQARIFYAITMTASNLYSVHYIIGRKDVAIPYKLIAGVFIVGRQMYVEA